MKSVLLTAVLLLCSTSFASPVSLEIEVPEGAKGIYFKIQNVEINECDRSSVEITGDESGKLGHYHISPVYSAKTCFSTDSKTVGLFTSADLEFSDVQARMITVHIDSDQISSLKIYFRK